VNVGDSRAYRLDRDDQERPTLSRMTEDHSVVEEMVRSGELTPAEAAVHPHRHVLTRALGIDADVDVDIWDLEPVVGSRYVLCSDGLSDEVPEGEIARVLATVADPHEAARALVEAALTRGGIDNVTVVVIDVVDADPADELQALEMVPARMPAPDRDDDRLGPDVTQALPVTRSRQPDGTEPGPPAGGADAGVLSAGEAAAGLAAGAAGGLGEGLATGPPAAELPAQGRSEVPGGEVDDPDATTALRAPSSHLFDAEADGDEPPGAGRGTDPGGLATTGVLGAAGAGGESDVSLAERRSRTGRSITVRAAPPPGSSLAPAAEHTGAHGRATVLVPTGRLSRQYRDRVVTFRVFTFLVLLAGLLGGAVAVVIWFQRSSYFVGLSGDRVSIFAGRPGGLLWFKPQLVETSSLTTSDLLPNSVVEVRHGIPESSYGAAKQELLSLVRLSTALGMNPDAPTTTTTATNPPAASTSSVPSTTSPPSTTAVTTTTTPPSTTAVPTTTSPKVTSTTAKAGGAGGGG
ncbi:MAG TPA: hypothetical protein VKU92_07130, partial [Acidimicrobiales bacterium]|nr:hypothetical protein [Acidimicrobiales bacterium]